jgi:hypothetical protein
MGYENEDVEGKSAIPKQVLFKVGGLLSVLPAIAILCGSHALVPVVGIVVGMAVVALLQSRARYVISVSQWAIATAFVSQAASMLLLTYLFGFSPMSLIGSFGAAAGQGFTLQTEFSSDVRTMSVILPCANEGIFAVKTARSLGELTPKDVLIEIIVVDDGSTPPLGMISSSFALIFYSQRNTSGSTVQMCFLSIP